MMRALIKLIALIPILLVSAGVFAQEKSFCLVNCGETIRYYASFPAQSLTEAITAYPYPNVQPLQVRDEIIYDRNYRRIDGAVNIYDAPNGNIIKSYDQGFTYFTISNTANGWAEIAPGEWVRSDLLNEDVLISRFAGVHLPDEPLPYPMAWVLRHLRPSKAPGLDEAPDNPFLYRYTRVNIYNSVELDGFTWYQIGENQWIHQFNIAKILPVARPSTVDTEKWISVDLYEQVAIAYEGNKPVFATLISSGLDEWPTNEGTFHIYLAFDRTTMAGAFARPDFYRLEEVPYTMYFDGDIALHGTYWHDGFGFRQSHGCVNLSISDAKWIFEWSKDQFDWTSPNPRGAAIHVWSSGVYDT